MTATDILFSAISELTGGLISDLTTAMIGMVVVGFIVMGVDYLKDCFETHIDNRKRDQSIVDARKYRSVAENQYIDPVLRDVYRARYRDAVRRASR